MALLMMMTTMTMLMAMMTARMTVMNMMVIMIIYEDILYQAYKTSFNKTMNICENIIHIIVRQ